MPWVSILKSALLNTTPRLVIILDISDHTKYTTNPKQKYYKGNEESNRLVQYRLHVLIVMVLSRYLCMFEIH